MILRSGKRPGLNKRLILIFLALWTAYAVSPVFVWAAVTSSGRLEKSGPNIYFCELVCKRHITGKKSPGLMVLCNKQRANKKEEPLIAPAPEGGPSAVRAASEWRSFSHGKVSQCLCREVNTRRDLMSIYLTHSPPGV